MADSMPVPPHMAGEEETEKMRMQYLTKEERAEYQAIIQKSIKPLSSRAASQAALETMPQELSKIISNAREIVKGNTYYPGKPLGHRDAVVLLADRVVELERENAATHRAYLDEIKLQNEYEGQIHALKTQLAALHSSATQETPND